MKAKDMHLTSVLILQWEIKPKTASATIHLEKEYPCDKCDYTAIQKSNIRRRKISINEGKRYAFEQCAPHTLVENQA